MGKDGNWKKLARYEYTEYKNRMHKETKGTYVLIYLGLIFSVVMSMMFGFRYEKEDMIMIFTISMGIGVIYKIAVLYLSTVKEYGIRQNIFTKYTHTPVPLSMLRKAKLIVMCRVLALPVFCSQCMAVLVRICDPDHDGGSLLDITVWIPSILAVVFVCLEYLEWMALSEKARKNA
ncbi:MAG: hypothetical protein ACI4EK_02685 [Wujia sp.]